MCKKTYFKLHRLHLLIPLTLIVIIAFGVVVNPIYLLLLPLPLYFLCNRKYSVGPVIIYLLICIALGVWCFTLYNFSLLKLLHNLIDMLCGFSIRNKIINWINNNYNSQTSSFINLIVFNVKNSTSYVIYDKMIDLSIVYMVVISGFHLSIFKYFVSKICRNRALGNSISLVFILFYSFLLDFSSSSIRVLLCLIIRMSTKNKFNKYTILGISGLISIFLNPSCTTNYGFCLSYLCTGIIYLIFDLNINNFFIEKILINIMAVTISLPFVLLMNSQISLWSIVFGFIFTYFFCFVFIYFLLTFWIIWIVPVQQAIVFVIIYVINAFYLINISIKFNNIAPILICAYYYLYFLLIIYLRKKNITKNPTNYDAYLLRTR